MAVLLVSNSSGKTPNMGSRDDMLGDSPLIFRHDDDVLE